MSTTSTAPASTSTDESTKLTGWAMPNWGSDSPSGNQPTILSNGTVIGIAIGAVATLGVVIGLIYFITRHKTRQRRESAATLIGDSEQGKKDGYLGNDDLPAYQPYQTENYDPARPRTQRIDSAATCVPAYSEHPIPLYKLPNLPSPKTRCQDLDSGDIGSKPGYS